MSEMNSNTSDQEIVSIRVLNFPREVVFKAYTDPDQLVKWWGPKGFTNTFHEFDLRVGGAWRFIMHSPDGKNYPNEAVFVEITPPERLVFDHVSLPKFRVTITFEALGQKTRVTFRQRFGSAEECRRIKVYAAPANEENFDRVEALLAGVLPV